MIQWRVIKGREYRRAELSSEGDEWGWPSPERVHLHHVGLFPGSLLSSLLRGLLLHGLRVPVGVDWRSGAGVSLGLGSRMRGGWTLQWLRIAVTVICVLYAPLLALQGGQAIIFLVSACFVRTLRRTGPIHVTLVTTSLYEGGQSENMSRKKRESKNFQIFPAPAHHCALGACLWQRTITHTGCERERA
jgi:hypothetical protein